MISNKTLYQMCISEMRYGMIRNNHLQPWTAIENTKEVLLYLKDNKEDTEDAKFNWAIKTAEQLRDEINFELPMYEYKREVFKGDNAENKKILEEFIDWLNDFIATI